MQATRVSNKAILAGTLMYDELYLNPWRVISLTICVINTYPNFGSSLLFGFAQVVNVKKVGVHFTRA